MCNFAKANVSESPEEPIGGGKTRRVSERERKKEGRKLLPPNYICTFVKTNSKGFGTVEHSVRWRAEQLQLPPRTHITCQAERFPLQLPHFDQSGASAAVRNNQKKSPPLNQVAAAYKAQLTFDTISFTDQLADRWEVIERL